MFVEATPEKCGISSKRVLEFLKTLDSYGMSVHSIIMARGNEVFTECYYKPFEHAYKHRMYSVSKSFVSLAIGFLADEGRISLDDKFADFFGEYDISSDEYMKEATIRDMLSMQTSMHYAIDWFSKKPRNRADVYFEKTSEKIPGTIFSYDSPCSYMLGVIVEKLTGKPFMEYLKEKVLYDIGFSDDAYCLKAPGGYSFGDSGVMCTSRDLLAVARFVLNGGTWNGRRYISQEYLNEATTSIACNGDGRASGHRGYGYGYQFWITPGNGFAFVGMGDQLAICDRDKDFIFIITADNQGFDAGRVIIYHELYKSIIGNLSTPVKEDKKAFSKLIDYIKSAELMHLKHDGDNPLAERIENITYSLQDNPMGIEYVRFNFIGKKGTLYFKNAQGEKSLTFGIGYNEFGNFPQEGYSDMTATEYAPGNMYRCACSADFPKEDMLRIRVQIIDKYFGNGCFLFGFKNNMIAVEMKKTAEAFMLEYEGIAMGERKN